MNQDTSLPPEPQATGKNKNNNTKIYVALESLAVDGTTPQVGDKVSLDVEGTVESIESGLACVKPDTINGEPPVEPPAPKSARDQAYESMSAQDQMSA